MYTLKTNVNIVIRGMGILSKKNIENPEGQALARYVVENMPQYAHNIAGEGTKVERNTAIDVEIKKKDTSLTSKNQQIDGTSSQNNSEEPQSQLSESKPPQESEPRSSQPKKSDVSEATEKPSRGRKKKS